MKVYLNTSNRVNLDTDTSLYNYRGLWTDNWWSRTLWIYNNSQSLTTKRPTKMKPRKSGTIPILFTSTEQLMEEPILSNLKMEIVKRVNHSINVNESMKVGSHTEIQT